MIPTTNFSGRAARFASIFTAFALPALLSAQATDLFISEYVEQGGDKYIEIFNGTGASVDLSPYRVELYSNGNSSAGSGFDLSSASSSLADGGVIVLANSSSTAYSGPVTTSGAINFNGDDAFALLKNGAVIDVIGVIGVRNNIFEDLSLRRLETVESPVTVFDSSEWTEFAPPDYSNLGTHTFTGVGEPDPEPSNHVTGLSATSDGVLGGTLTWTDATGAQLPAGYAILFSSTGAPTAPVDGTPVAADLDYSDGTGAALVPQGTQTLTLSGLASDTTYTFAIYPYTNGGSRIDFLTSGTVPTTTLMTASVVLSESFATQGDWQVVTQGAGPEWEFVGGAARANAFGGTGPADDWLISPQVDFSTASNLVLSFDARQGFDDTAFNPALSVYVLTNYDGSGTTTALDAATKTALTVVLPTAPGTTFENTGNTSLSAFSGTGYLAFRYQSSGTAGSSSEQWEVDNVLVFPSDESVAALSLSVSPASISEDAAADAVTLTISVPEAVNSDLTVNLSSDADTTLSVPTTATIPSGQASVTVKVGPASGLSLSAAQAVHLTASADGFLSGAATVTVNPAAAPFLTLSIDPSTVDEGSTTTGTVTLSKAAASAVVVNLASSDTTEATVPVSFTIASGSLSGTFQITGVADSTYDLDGSATITASTADSSYAAATANVTVNNVDAEPALGISVNPTSIFENAGAAAATVTVTLPADPLQGYPVTVTLTDSDSDDSEISYTATATIGATDNRTATFALDALTDGAVDGNQTVQLTASVNGFQDASTNLEVVDVDQSGGNYVLTLAISPSTLAEGASATGTVSLSRTVAEATVVRLTNGDASELTIPDSVTIPAGGATATFTVQAVADLMVDGTQKVTVFAAALEGLTASREVTVLDLDVPNALSISLAASSVNEGESTTATISVNNVRSGGLTVTLTNPDATEVSLGASTIHFAAGETSKAVAVQTLDDGQVDGNQTISLQASASGYPNSSASLTVVDRNLPNTLSLSVGATTLNEGEATTGTLTLTRTNPAAAVTVTLKSSDGTELAVSPTSLTIPAGAATESVSLTLSALADELVDADASVTLSASAAGFPGASTTISVKNVDVERILTLSFAQDSVTEGSSVVGNLSLSTAPKAALTVTLTSGARADLDFVRSVTIPAGSTSASFAVSAVANDGYEGDETATVSATAEGWTGDSATLSILNTDPRLRWVRPLTAVTQTFAVQQDITLLVEVANPDNDLREVVFMLGEDIIGRDATAPYRMTYRASQEGALQFWAFVVTNDNASSDPVGVSVLVKKDPVRDDRNFLTEMISRLLPGVDVDSRLATYENVLATTGSRATAVAAMLDEPSLQTTRSTIETYLLLTGRFPTVDQLFNDPASVFYIEDVLVTIPPFFDVVDAGPELYFDADTYYFSGGIRGLAVVLMSFDDAVASHLGGDPVTLLRRDFFTKVWQQRHSREPTAQQIVQASSRIEVYSADAPDGLDPELYGRARFIEGLVREEKFEFGTDVIYNPPNHHSQDDSLVALLYGALWSDASDSGDFGLTVADAATWRGLDLEDLITILLEHPNFWEQFDYAWLGATGVGEDSAWKVSDWFGWFYVDPANWPWVYHQTHGFIYVGRDDRDGGGIWFYDRTLGWAWTASVRFPWFYRATTKSWYYYLDGTTGPRWFYGLDEGAWLQVP